MATRSYGMRDAIPGVVDLDCEFLQAGAGGPNDADRSFPDGIRKTDADPIYQAGAAIGPMPSRPLSCASFFN